MACCACCLLSGRAWLAERQEFCTLVGARGGNDLWVWLASLLMSLLTYCLERLFLALKRNTDLFSLASKLRRRRPKRTVSSEEMRSKKVCVCARCVGLLGKCHAALHLHQFSATGPSSRKDTALLVKIIQKPVSVFFFPSA